MQSALVRGRATRSCGPSVDPARKLRGMTSPVTVHALLCSMRILAFSRLHVVFSLSCRLFHTTRFFHFQFSTLSTSLFVIPRQTIWHPFFCCETNPYLGLPCTPAFTMLALGMPEDWQPPPDLSAIHLQTASHGSLSSTVNAFGPRSSIQIQPSAR